MDIGTLMDVGGQWLPMADNGLPMVANDCQWLPMVANGCQWLPMTTNGYHCPTLDWRSGDFE
jgi:hypothetical protein